MPCLVLVIRKLLQDLKDEFIQIRCFQEFSVVSEDLSERGDVIDI